MPKHKKTKLHNKAAHEHVNLRDSLCDGRTEAFKSCFRCQDGEETYYYDVVSLYPSVNALDKYPVGFEHFLNPTIEELLDASFVGVVKCDVIPPKTYLLPVLPETKDGKLYEWNLVFC